MSPFVDVVDKITVPAIVAVDITVRLLSFVKIIRNDAL